MPRNKLVALSLAGGLLSVLGAVALASPSLLTLDLAPSAAAHAPAAVGDLTPQPDVPAPPHHEKEAHEHEWEGFDD